MSVCLFLPIPPEGSETGPKAPKPEPQALTQTENMLAKGQHESSVLYTGRIAKTFGL